MLLRSTIDTARRNSKMVAKRRQKQAKLTRNIKSLLKTTTLLTASILMQPGRADENNTLGTVGKLKILIMGNSLAEKQFLKFNIHMFF